MGCKPCQAAAAAAKVLSGSVKAVDDAVKSARLDICRHCPELVRFHKGLPDGADIGLLDTCAACGCVLRAKASFGFSCPKGKWAD